MSASSGPAATTQPAERQQWSGQIGFIISAIGSAVGLGNIWRFPGVAYENGGGAFMIPYLIALLTAGIPILLLDYAIGHRFRGSAPLAFRRLKKWLESLGWFQVMICVFIAIYYAVILAWAASFFVFSFGQKWGDDPSSFFYGDYLHLADTAGFSSDYISGIVIPLAAIWVLTIAVLALGVAKGLEKANIIFIPLLVVAFGALVVRAVTLEGAADGLNALFTPDWSKITDASVWIAAYSQIFFSLSIAFGIMVTYSSYRRRRSNQTTPGLVVGFANSSFELLAGIGVFSILGFMAHEQGIAVSELSGLKGTSLAFITFPKAISQMPSAAWLFGALFFASLFLAGFTSLISIVEVVSAGFQDKFGWSYRKAAVSIGVVLGIISVALFSSATGLYTLDVMDNWANNFCVVLSAIVMSIAVVWVLRRGRELAFHLSSLSTFKVKTTWLALIGVVAPVMLLYMFVQTVYSLVTEGYDPAYDAWFEGLFGWGTVVACVVGAAVMTALRWKHDPDRFEPWPPYAAPPARLTAGK
ncbi:MAG: sodium-dependent transporter [Propionibacteriaceae bacterium]|jgi:NSS family neurotransmitter:Na+ symporter|nr:sodium-dependent transporter [Propionibacteriaceae bacterium]